MGAVQNLEGEQVCAAQPGDACPAWAIFNDLGQAGGQKGDSSLGSSVRLTIALFMMLVQMRS